jgi:ABC-2 type transport system ATP-binding protein
MSQIVIDVQHITKTFGSFNAVDSLTFDVQAGEIFALLGPIRMILDIIKPDKGAIRVFGAPLNDASKNRIGYLPEERGLYKSVPVLEMMSYLGRLKGLTARDATQRAMSLLEKLELAEHAKKKASELSKGMQQKVQFAITIQHNPDLIIVDEPFSGLDPINRMVIKQLLEEFRERGGAIIMSTHQMNQVEEMADRLLMISQGERKLYGEVGAIRKQFAQNAVIVQGRGDWAALPGVTRVEPHTNGQQGAMLHLAANTTTDSLLEAIARNRDISIEKFELAIPGLDEIFIQAAGYQGAGMAGLPAEE